MNFWTKEFFRQGRTLIGLRYRLIWAQARSSQGMIASLLALYLLGAMGALLFAFGGLGAAIAAIQLGQGESISRWMLTSLYANGFGLSLLFGFGARAAFTEGALRRYPLGAEQRFLVRHGIGLFDPVWLILVAGAAGLAVGLAWLGAGGLAQGMMAAAFFILASYLTTAVLLSIVNRLMMTRGGTAILWGGVLTIFSFGPMIAGSLAPSTTRAIWRMIDRLLIWLPPGVAAGTMVADRFVSIVWRLGLLLLWCVGLALFLRWIEHLPIRSGREDGVAATGAVIANDLVAQVSRMFGRRYSPLVEKSLRYHLRCNLIRYSLATSPLLVIVIRFFNANQQEDGFLLNSALIFYMMSCATAAGMMLNLLGFDGAGVRRYAIVPAPMGDALRAGSLASMLLRLGVVLMAFLFWTILYWREPKSWRMVAILIGVSLTGTLLFNAIGLWVSIFSAKSVDFDSMWNNRLSLTANLVVVAGVLVPFILSTTLVKGYGRSILLVYWWVPLLTALLGLAAYLLSFNYLDRALKLMSESIIRKVAGAS